MVNYVPAAESQNSRASRGNDFSAAVQRFSPSNTLAKAAVNDPNLCYYVALIDPESKPGAKVPDNSNMATATYQTVITASVYGNTAVGTAATDKGRFFFAIQPCITDQTTFNNTNQVATIAYMNPAQIWTSPANSTVTAMINDDNATIMVPNRAVPRSGLMMRARPVSMSVWFQYLGDLINNGGEIAAALVTGDTWGNNITTNSGTTNLMNWEYLADYPDAYQGSLAQGSYTWWRPYGPGDYEFRPVDANAKTRAMYQYDFPTIFVAGQANHSGDSTANQPCGRIRVVINYEYETDSRVVPSIPSPVNPLAMALAAKLTAGQATAMANEEHGSWIRDMLKYGVTAVSGFALGGPLGAAAALLGTMGISRLTSK